MCSISFGAGSKKAEFTFHDCLALFNEAVPPEKRTVFIGLNVGRGATDYGNWKGIGCFRHNVRLFKICDELRKGGKNIPNEWLGLLPEQPQPVKSVPKEKK